MNKTIEMLEEKYSSESVVQAMAVISLAASWLDIEKPGWEGEIDIERLMIEDPQECILGQTFAKEAIKASELSGYSLMMDKFWEWAKTEGMSLDTGWHPFAMNNDIGNALWEKEILERRYRVVFD